MKQKRYSIIITLALLSVLLYSCGQDVSAADSKGEIVVKENIDYLPSKVIGPTTELTLENLITGTQTSYESVYDFYTKMQDLATAENASKKGKKAAAKVEKKYADRLEELADIDFSQMTSEELLSLSLELTDIGSAIREALDILSAN